MKPPWHLWLVGILSLLWNAGGAYDYFMSKTRNADYLAALTPEQQAFFDSFPLWVNITWALGVWGAVLGSVFLLLRSRFAVTAFAVSLLGAVLSAVRNFLVADPSMAEVAGSFAIVFSLVILIVAFLLLVYARAMRRNGVLR